MSPRRRRTLTARGAGCLALGVLLVIAGGVAAAPALQYVGALLVLLTVIAVLAVRLPRRRGTVTRVIATDLVAVGEASRVSVRFDLVAPGIPRGVWRDVLPDAVSGTASGEYPDGSRVLRYEITGVRRGISTLGPLILRTVDPFGLAQREQVFGDTRTITVVPQVSALAPLPTRVGAAGGTAQTRSSRLGQGSDDLIPRRYVSGDSMRRIHWRATAHRGDLMVRQEEEESSPDAMVVLDRSAARWPRAGEEPDPGFEAAVSLCASAALRFMQDGYSVDVLDSSGTLLGALRGHEDDRDGLLVALAALAPRGEARDIRSLVGGTAPGPLVMITGRLSEEDAGHLSTAGAAAPMLFASAPEAGALAAASHRGWRTAHLRTGDDLAEVWADALPEFGSARV
ncbi:MULTISPECIES: DUF58 domain-containing protein [Microbacterium]|uniref:DUF58 domain-containing protein n=1 Tax=Microbacterium TaxID=33882 RepID=UPI00217D1150|nr:MULTISPECIES: DUF58 domain-containing protein [Microbacterium]UWF77121.1 DUF58 domain-containing protein [Microbacterium neungamense]WCM55282.1 DUF58 domain-containing protein [Microbacterium sp. EF45047]